MDPRDAFKKFSEPAKRVLEAAEHYGDEMGQSINSEHLLLALASVPHTVAQDILRDNLINLDQIKLILSLRGPETNMSSGISDPAKEVIAIAAQAAAEFAHGHIDPEHILLGIVSLPESLAYQIINRIGANPSAIRQQLVRLFENLASADGTLRRLGQEPERAFAGASAGPGTKTAPKTKTKTPALDYFTIKLTEAARDNKLDPVIGRENEIQRVMQILSRRRKNNPVLVGDPGVGKTAIVEGLAIKIAKGEVPNPLKNREIYNLDLALVVAGTTYRGQFEERLKKIVSEAKKTANSILFIDELHTLVGAGAAEGSMDAANILKPALAKGEIRLIGATTSEEYRKYIERDAALERRLQRIGVAEPSLEQTVAILKGLRARYEEHHGVMITDEAITAAAELASRYIADRQLPDKAIDLVDEAAASTQLQKPFSDNPELNTKQEELARVIERKEKAVEEQQFELAASLRAQELELETGIRKIKQTERAKSKLSIDERDIAKAVASWTGIPVGELTTDERLRLKNLEEILKAKVVGQNEAIEAVAKTVRRAKSGLGNPNRPIGSFVFLGPSGVGKTYLAKTLAETVYGKPEAFVKIDMSEFMERHNVSRLLGAPPGYV
ncbi:ATP-dependent Clp protease ATP-binding subunit, partial [Candidatus Berkelbacteria bacterium]|nr:ATP-dependent Clp protease ATP-binding subunit [Candidatus Berkelbacteria bacterium]